MDVSTTDSSVALSGMMEEGTMPLHSVSKEIVDIQALPISYKYLTFEVELPNLSQTTPDDALCPPNLNKYTSPYDWSPVRKHLTTTMCCISTVFASFSASCYSPGVEQMSSEWRISDVAILVGITTFTSGFAVGPMFLAPISEATGRRNVFVATAILFTVCQLCCAVTRSYPGMLVARFFAGVGGSTFSTMVGGIVADMYQAQDRNMPMALFSGAALFGTALGPLVCGFIGQYASWRWIFYMQIIIGGSISLAVALFFKETRASVLLEAKANALNDWYDKLESNGQYNFYASGNGMESSASVALRIRWKVEENEKRPGLASLIGTSVQRPFMMLLTEPILFFFSLWAAFSWSVLYINLSVIPLVFSEIYDFSLSEADAVFAAAVIGSLLAMIFSILRERLSNKRKCWNPEPEYRLYFSCGESVLLPIGLFIFGWTAQFHVHWIVPTLAVGISTMGIFSIYLAVFNYLADIYHRYASSALAAQSFCRNMLGGIFPLGVSLLWAEGKGTE